MSTRTAISEWLKIIIYIGIIGIIALALVWGGLSVYANITENDNDSVYPDLPKVKKAEYAVYIKANGNLLLTSNYESPAPGVYVLNGYYESNGEKWVYRDAILKLNEKTFGEITISRRS